MKSGLKSNFWFEIKEAGYFLSEKYFFLRFELKLYGWKFLSALVKFLEIFRIGWEEVGLYINKEVCSCTANLKSSSNSE